MYPHVVRVLFMRILNPYTGVGDHHITAHFSTEFIISMSDVSHVCDFAYPHCFSQLLKAGSGLGMMTHICVLGITWLQHILHSIVRPCTQLLAPYTIHHKVLFACSYQLLVGDQIVDKVHLDCSLVTILLSTELVNFSCQSAHGTTQHACAYKENLTITTISNISTSIA